ncbi:MAG: hypothetical protein WDM84_00330 [Bauldia sp.]
MSMRNALVAVSVATLLASSTWAALADSGTSGSQGSASVNSSGSQGAGSTVSVGAQGSQAAAATPGGQGLAGTANGGGGFAFVWGTQDGNSGSDGSFAVAGSGTTGFAFAKSGLSTPVTPGSPSSSPVAGGSYGGPIACVVTIKDHAKWSALGAGVQRVVQRCGCPTIPAKAFSSNKLCPAISDEIFVAALE